MNLHKKASKFYKKSKFFNHLPNSRRKFLIDFTLDFIYNKFVENEYETKGSEIL